VRFECRFLVGKAFHCQQLESHLAGWPEVLQATANHRTGRVLIRFDESVIQREELTLKLNAFLASDECRCAPEVSPALKVTEIPQKKSSSTRHLVRDLLVHAVLPAPLDMLVPAALAVAKR
jgi:hypothetical protein